MRRLLVAVASALACWMAVSDVAADPSVWARARRPALEARRRLLAQVGELRAEAERKAIGAGRFDDGAVTIVRVFLRDARKLLESAGARESRDQDLLLAYAEVLHDLDEHAAAIAAYEALLALSPPPAMAAEIHPALATSYARLKQSRLEIAAYDAALELEPHSVNRARMLANRAEAFMTLGDLTSAIDGYRSALALLSQHDMQWYGVTTLWGFAVASDRAGDLDGALDAIKLARLYDARDAAINSSGWFYVLEYDKHWYEALGHWSAARHAELAATRTESYARAVAAWEEYLAKADASEPWIAVARARLAQCQRERERAALQRRAPRPALRPGVPAPPPRSRRP